MAIENKHDMLWVKCDDCENVSGPFVTVQEVLEYIESDGWDRVKVNDDWYVRCQTCDDKIR